MAHEVFISYRRGESKPQAQQLKALLGRQFGNEAVFLDEKDIQPGDRFDQRLKQSLASAQAVLVLVGPTWLDVLEERASQPAEDWVRMEVTQALAQVSCGATALLIPLLLPGASLPKDGDWPAALKSELELFSKYQADAVTLVEPLTAVDDLALLLLTKAGLRCPGDGSHRSLSEITKSMQELLHTQFRMQDIAQHWPQQPLPMSPGHDILSAISGLHVAIRRAMPAWLEMTDPLQRHGVASSCRRVLSLLYQMAVNPGVALFFDDATPKHPVPAQSTAGAVQVVATLQGKPMTFGAGSAHSHHPRLEGVVEMGITRPGVGSDRQRAVQQQVWNEVAVHSPRLGLCPAGDGPLTAADRARLATALAAIAARGQHVLLAERLDLQAPVPPGSVAMAAQLGLPYVPHSEQPLSAYRHPEGDLNYRVLDCLDEIAKLTT